MGKAVDCSGIRDSCLEMTAFQLKQVRIIATLSITLLVKRLSLLEIVTKEPW
jgi:hypothetical protein